MRHYGISEKFISLIRGTYQDMKCRVAHAGQLFDSFDVKTGVRQGCILSPFLFLLAIDWIMKTTTAGRRNGIQWTLFDQLEDLDFADDLALLSHNHAQMQDKTTHLETISAGVGLKINKRKTELIKTSTTADNPVMIKEVESFVYLGNVIDGQGGSDRDVKARIGRMHKLTYESSFPCLGYQTMASAKGKPVTVSELHSFLRERGVTFSDYRKHEVSDLVQKAFEIKLPIDPEALK
ncbi:hypothetical protein V1264_018213 [Littorina saxatilis]|uniref:Reverse transcriptase domain-containing protein n=1 Tax=Littorina saxatilis TaxID=31220 RepID=A0AAN9BCZ1_9CAEN